MLPLGLVAYGIVVLAAWAVPIVLGADFREAGPLLMVVGLALPAMALQTPPADVLTAAQKHKTRAGCYWAFALGFVPLAVAAASTSGAIGVAWAFVGVNVVLAVMLWIVVVVNARGES
jgi:O-antigen/teichoic acid export membrane protein